MVAQIFVDVDDSGPSGTTQAVRILQWPEQAREADELARAGHLRLLLVAPGVAPPADADLASDWLRRPTDAQDVLAKVEALQHRTDTTARTTRVDEDGLLWRGADWVALSPVESRLMTLLVDNAETLVRRSELDAAAWPDGCPGPRALDSRLQRLRARVAPLGLRVVTVRRRGFLLSAVGG
jgi:hypothetical protein